MMILGLLNVSAGENNVLDRKIQNVLNQCMTILQQNSFEESAERIIPLMHKSLLDRTQKRLDDDIYRFSFKKAYTNAKNYQAPVKVTRRQRLKTTGIGYGKTYEKGTEYKYWISKKASVAGMPAPLVVFVKEGTTEVKLSYIGSL